VASALYTGPIARAIGGIDLSWIVGLAVTSPVYYWLAKRTRSRQDAETVPTAEVRAGA
jgi:NCS1 family nucleobase:cation symporter-1